jgi:hypothetical protein
MVPPAKASDHPVTHRHWYSYWTKWPSQCTDALHRRPAGPSGAEEHPLGAVLCSSNTGIRWTAEMILKHRFIRWWSNSFGASLYDLNVSVRWTVESTVGSSGAEAVETQSVLLPNPKASDEPLPIPSVHPTVTFEVLGRWIHPAHLEMQASVHLTVCFEFQLVQFKRLWVFRRFFCFYFAFMITMSWLTSKELECAYFHGFLCMVKLLVHEPLLIVRSNTTN